jgi:hypothetical protein
LDPLLVWCIANYLVLHIYSSLKEIPVFTIALPWHVGPSQVSSSLSDSYSSPISTSDSLELTLKDVNANKPDNITNKLRVSSRIKKIPVTKKDDFLW